MADSTTATLPSGFEAPTRTTSSATATCTTAVPGKYGHVDDPTACNAQWSYNPSFEAAILFAVLFGLALVAHVAQAFLYRKRYTWVMIMGVAWELGSFSTRIVATRHQQSQTLVIVSQLLLLLAPLWINAFAYMTLGRLIHYFHPLRRIYRIKAASIAKYFVWADVVSFLVQATGGSMLSPGNSSSTMRNGLHIYMGGVGLQEAFIVVFTILGIKFQIDMQRYEATGQTHSDRSGWRTQIWNMYAVLVLITIRIIFRLIEYARGTDPSNPIPYHEAYTYALDAVPMFFAVVMLIVFHPGGVLRGPESEFPKLSRKEKKALKQAKKEQKQQRKEGRKFGRRNTSRNKGYTNDTFQEVELMTTREGGAEMDTRTTQAY